MNSFHSFPYYIISLYSNVVVYFRKWEDFTTAARDLAKEHPEKTRYCLRWKHSEGLLVLKVTDDAKCLKFKTRSSLYLNRFELFTRTLLADFQNRKVPPASIFTSPVVSTGGKPAALPTTSKTTEKGEDAMNVDENEIGLRTESGATAGTGPSKKKKKGKKK